MYHPPDLPGPVDNVRDEFVELLNPTPKRVALYDETFPTNTWRLRGGVDFDFPSNVALTAGQRLLVVSFNPATDTNSLAAFRAAYPSLPTNTLLFGPYSGRLDNGGEGVELRKPGAPVAGQVPYITVERIRYDDAYPWDGGADGSGYSVHRLEPLLYGNDPANWRAAAPTPGAGFEPITDSDGDGIPDWWMLYYFGHPTGQPGDNSLANQDADHDGLTNLQEYEAGTSPIDPASLLRLEVLANGIVVGGQTVLYFEGVATKSYTVEYTDRLPSAWNNLINFDPLSVSGTVWVTNQAPPGTAQRFYRVLTPRQQ
jgi:hypothetical protein